MLVGECANDRFGICMLWSIITLDGLLGQIKSCTVVQIKQSFFFSRHGSKHLDRAKFYCSCGMKNPIYGFPQAAVCAAYLQNSFPARILKNLLYSIILMSSLFGNALITTTVRKRVELRNTVNYFIVNKAVSYFIFPLLTISVHLIQTANSSQEFSFEGTTGLIFCKLKWFLQIVSGTVSVSSLVWIALDRFVAVVLPMKVHLISSRCRVFAIASTWIVAIIVNSSYMRSIW